MNQRLQLQTLQPRHWGLIALLLLAGLFLGRAASRWMAALAQRLTQDELTSRMLQSLLCCFSTGIRWLLPVLAVLVALFMIMDSDPLPPTIAVLLMLACYLVIAPAMGAFLSPREPARMFLPIDAAYGDFLNRRLQTLLLLGLVILLVRVTEVQTALTTSQWHLTRSVLLLLTGINLVWLLSLLNRLPGLIGSTLVRGIMMAVLLASMTAEVSGYRNLSSYLFVGLTGTTLLAGSLWLAIALLTDIFDGLDEGRHRWQRSIRRRLRLEDKEPMPGLLWLRLVTMLMAWTFFVISAVRLWGYNAASWTALWRLLSEGFELGDFRIVPMKLFVGILIFSLLITFLRWFRQETLPDWLRRTRLDHGAREAVVSISGYVGAIVAALFGLSLAGFSFTNIAIIAGALSVGIGFGLQNIVNNFVSGLILLFERPIRTGDWVEVGTTTGFVRKISIRSTQIETFDRADIIVPNSELISTQVTNWMLNDEWGRVIVPVGVAYGSDVEKVKEVLLKTAQEHPLVMTDGMNVDPPRVLFRAFGDSSLNFELRCFIREVNRRLGTQSDLNFAIEKGLREAGIEIPFPQRDLHLRSVSEKAGVMLRNPTQQGEPPAE